MQQLAREHGVSMANAFYWNACSHCGMLWYPGVSCGVRLWGGRKLGGLPRRRVLWLSRVMFSAAGKDRQDDALFVVGDHLPFGQLDTTIMGAGVSVWRMPVVQRL